MDEAMTTRRCRDCGLDKPLSEFYHLSNSASYFSRCKRCHNARTTENERRRKAADPVAFRAHRREILQRYRARHREQDRVE